MGHDADSLAMIQVEHDLMPVVPILLLTGMAIEVVCLWAILQAPRFSSGLSITRALSLSVSS